MHIRTEWKLLIWRMHLILIKLRENIFLIQSNKWLNYKIISWAAQKYLKKSWIGKDYPCEKYYHLFHKRSLSKSLIISNITLWKLWMKKYSQNQKIDWIANCFQNLVGQPHTEISPKLFETLHVMRIITLIIKVKVKEICQHLIFNRGVVKKKNTEGNLCLISRIMDLISAAIIIILLKVNL